MATSVRREQLVIRRAGDEAVVYQTAQHTMHRLNRVTVEILDACDGNRSPVEISELVSARVGSTVSVELVRPMLLKLQDAGLVSGAPQAEPSDRMRRREMIRRMGRMAVAAAIPVLITLSAPQPAQAQSAPDPCAAASGRPAGCPCSTPQLFGQGQCANGLVCIPERGFNHRGPAGPLDEFAQQTFNGSCGQQPD